MITLILTTPLVSTLWRDVTNGYKPPHVKIGCAIGDRVTQIFICLSVYKVRWWAAAAAVKCRCPFNLTNSREKGGMNGVECTSIPWFWSVFYVKVGTSTSP